MRKFSSFSPRCPCWRRNTWKSCLKTASNSTQLSFVMASPTRTSLPEITMINQFKRSISLNLIARKVLRRLDFWYERKKVCSISYKKNCRAQIDQAYAGNGLSTECCVPSMSRSIRQVYCHFGCCACRWWRHRLMSHSSAQKSIWGGCVCFYRKRLYSSAHIAWATSTAKGKISDFFDPPPTVSNEFYAFLIQCLVASFECVSVWGLFTIPVREREREKKLYTHLGPPKLTFSLTPDHCLISFEQPRIHTHKRKKNELDICTTAAGAAHSSFIHFALPQPGLYGAAKGILLLWKIHVRRRCKNQKNQCWPRLYGALPGQ